MLVLKGSFFVFFCGFCKAFSWPSFWANFARIRPGKVFSLFHSVNGSRISGRRTSGTSRPSLGAQVLAIFGSFSREYGGAPKERRRRRAEKLLSKSVFWRVRFFFAPFEGFQDISGVLRAKLKGAKKKRTLQNTLLDNRFSARRLRRSFGALWDYRTSKKCLENAWESQTSFFQTSAAL